MIRNYLKIALRALYRNRLYTTINVLGLSMGICACIVIYLICSFEFSYDAFHPEVNRIYRIMGDMTENTGDKLHFGRLPTGVSENGRSEITGIDAIAGILPYNASATITDGNLPPKRFESWAVITQPQYFQIFKYRWLAGNASVALNGPNKIVLTEKRALQFFGKIPADNIIGRRMIYNDSLNVIVSGIVKDWEENTDLGFTEFISSASLQSGFLKRNINTTSWDEHDMNTWTFAKLAANSTPAQVNTKLAALVKKYEGHQNKLSLWLQPLTDMHFDANVIENTFRTADKPILYILIVIAFFILILATINFINLSTAQSIQRSKEVGVRKVLGGNRVSLIFQFLTESTVLTLVSVLLAILLVHPVLPAFYSFIPNGVKFNLFDPSTIIFLLVVTVTTSLLAGLYPAKVLSSYLPVLTLKGAGEQKGGEKWFLRKGLIVFQFSISLIFIIGSIIITRQLNFTREKNPGFNADAIINVDTPWQDSISKVAVLIQNIKQIPNVTNIALQWVPPMVGNGRGHDIKFNPADIKTVGVVQIAGDENFIPLYGIKLIAGRNLVHADSLKEIVINEKLSQLMGVKKPANAIGKTIYWDGKPFPVVGVVADFHTRSFHETIGPLCIVNRPDRQRTLAIKLTSSGKNAISIQGTLTQISKLWKGLYPGDTFKYQFYDESLALLYEKDQQTAILVNTATGVTIFISCIGLFGLALFTSEKRAKEISIRKILGASVAKITLMLSKEFALLVIIALLITSPIAWYFSNQWLRSFAYRIDVSVWVFLLAGVIVISISLLTVSFHAIRVALINPVKSLRSE